jgi:hypothetical protein
VSGTDHVRVRSGGGNGSGNGSGVDRIDELCAAEAPAAVREAVEVCFFLI